MSFVQRSIKPRHITPRATELFLLCLLFVLVFVAGACMPQQLNAQAQPKPKTVKILSVEVEGQSTIDAQAIINLSGLQIGDEIAFPVASKTAEAIKNLWKRKQFTDVTIDVVRETPSGVYLKIRVAEAQHVATIKIRGNQTVSNKDITKASDKTPGDLISQYDLNLIQKAVKQLYDKEGKQFAKVEVTLEPTDSTGFSTLIIAVKESVTFYTNSVTFSGNKDFSNSDIAGAFDDTKTKQWWQFWRSAKFDKKKYEKDKELLATFYKKNGYIDASVLRDSLAYSEDFETVDVFVWVDEGQKVYVRNISFEGNLVYPSQFLQLRLGMFKGDVFNVEKFEQNLRGNQEQSDVSSMYLNSGYLTARFEEETKRVAPDSVDITVRVFERNQFTIRRVEIEGNTKTKDKVIRRELFTRPGDYFSRAAIIRGVRSLGQLNYFNPEKIKPDVKPIDNSQVDLIYKVEERSSDTFNASVGYAGYYGVTGSVGITLNNFSLAEPLSGGAGQVFNFSWEFGGQGFNSLRTFSAGVSEPWLFDEPTTVGFNLYDTQYRFPYQLRLSGAAINIGRRLRWPDDYFRADWQVQGRYVQQPEGSISSYYKSGTEFSIRQTISRISIDNAIFPTDGSKFSFTTLFAAGALGIGQIDYLKSQLDFDVYTPLLAIGDNNRLVLRLASSFGYVTGLRDQTSIPQIERYFLGGTALGGFGTIPLRGYPDRSIGPRDAAPDSFGNPTGNAIGGRAIITSAAELRFAVTLNPVPIYLIGFLEGGNAWGSLGEVNPLDLKRSVGIGVRLLLNPIGLLGFDYGYGFDRVGSTSQDDGVPKFRFQFQFGR